MLCEAGWPARPLGDAQQEFPQGLAGGMCWTSLSSRQIRGPAKCKSCRSSSPRPLPEAAVGTLSLPVWEIREKRGEVQGLTSPQRSLPPATLVPTESLRPQGMSEGQPRMNLARCDLTNHSRWIMETFEAGGSIVSVFGGPCLTYWSNEG